MNILLLAVGSIFLISVFVGYKRGFLKIALSLAIVIGSIFLVGAVTPYVSGWLQESTSIGDVVQSKLAEMFESSTGMTTEMLNGAEISREQQISFIEGTPLPKVIQEMLLENNNNEVYATLGVTNFVDYLGNYITKIVVDVIAFVISWIFVSLAAMSIMSVIGIINKIPVIGGVNRIAGGVVGVGFAIIIVWILFIVVTLLYNTSFGKTCMENIAASPILTKLYDANVLMKFITKF